jgi:hypothetical protein
MCGSRRFRFKLMWSRSASVTERSSSAARVARDWVANSALSDGSRILRYHWMIASFTKARKLLAILSKRVPTRLHSLSYSTYRSTTLLRRYEVQSISNSPSRPISSLLCSTRLDPAPREPPTHPRIAVALLAGRLVGPALAARRAHLVQQLLELR